MYSSGKSKQSAQVPGLVNLCIRVLQRKIDNLDRTGNVPFELLKPVLEKATVHKLLLIEKHNPYLMKRSDILWQQHVLKNYRSEHRLENESWRAMFLRCHHNKERKLNLLTKRIKQKFAETPMRRTQLAFVDGMVKPPRNIQRKQKQYGTENKLVASPAARVAALAQISPNAVKIGDARLKASVNEIDYAHVSHSRARKAPLMLKTLKFIRGLRKC